VSFPLYIVLLLLLLVHQTMENIQEVNECR